MKRNRDTGSLRRDRRSLLCICVLAFVFTAAPADAQAVLKVNDRTYFRFGVLLQAWADAQQDATTRAYAKNLYLRRTRFIVGGQVTPDVTFFFQTDNASLGKAPKSLGTGFLLLDGWGEWKVRDQFRIVAGEFLIPLDRIVLSSASRFLTLDISPTATVSTGALAQANGNRDTGVEAKGYLIDGGRLEYRTALFQGIRGTGARNPFRKTAFVQYDFWDKERGYTFASTSLGQAKILALAAGYDRQKDYKGYSANLTAQVPMAGNEFATIIQAVHYDGGTLIKTIPRQNDFVTDLGYYAARWKLQPFLRFEEQRFATTTPPAATNQSRYGSGARYYISGLNLTLTGQLLRVVPRHSAAKSTNEVTLQLQVYYY